MSNSFSIIIPTLLKCRDTFSKLLNVLERSIPVTEIIIINNSDEHLQFLSSKIIVYSPDDNMFVNQSWNKGVELSTNDHIVLLSDDVLVPDSFFFRIKDVDFNQFGLVGQSDTHILNKKHDEIDFFDARDEGSIDYIGDYRNWGFGTIMVMKKENFYPAPDGMRVWYHDDLLLLRNRQAGKTNAVFKIPIMTQMSTTSDLPEYSPVKDNDKIVYEHYLQSLK